MVRRLCVSVSDEEAEWLEMNNQKPSKLLQDEIKRIREIMQTSKEIIDELRMKIEAREEHILKLNRKIEELGTNNVLEKETVN